jgi:thiamine biosynthesis protein ThiS
MALMLVVNGQRRELSTLEQGAALAHVIAELSLTADRVAVEHNGEIARRAAWETIPVHSGDKLEVVHFVGGG